MDVIVTAIGTNGIIRIGQKGVHKGVVEIQDGGDRWNLVYENGDIASVRKKYWRIETKET